MDLAALEIFRAVVDEGGVSAAARRLHRVQSNVTTRLQQLEAALDVRLFEREGKRLRITPAGTLLYRYAERLLALAAEAEARVRDSRHEEHLRLGAMESVAAARLPPLLAAFYRQHPEIRLELKTGTSQRLIQAVAAGQLDAALVGEAVDPQLYDSAVVWHEELVLVAHADQAAVGDPRDVRGRALLSFEAGCAYRRQIERWLASAQLVPEHTVELASYHAILACVAAGAGIAVVPRSLLAGYAERAALSVHALPPRFAQIAVRLISAREQPRAAIAALLQQLRSTPDAVAVAVAVVSGAGR